MRSSMRVIPSMSSSLIGRISKASVTAPRIAGVYSWPLHVIRQDVS
jgi:hypothetical protein